MCTYDNVKCLPCLLSFGISVEISPDGHQSKRARVATNQQYVRRTPRQMRHLNIRHTNKPIRRELFTIDPNTE